MATIQEIAPAPWRLALLPASFAGVQYHVEQQARTGGRRIVLHEYPKRDVPYAEDMGQHATRYQVTGYLIGPNYHLQKKALITVLESEQGGMLQDPYLPRSFKCVCERYSVTETRERGGYCTFEMAFTEAGTSGNTLVQVNSKVQLQNKSADASAGAATTVNGGIGHA